ncbi:MAG: TolC family protein [Puniceicoccaceae bacterium]
MKISIQKILPGLLIGSTLLGASTIPAVLDYETVVALARENNYSIRQAEARLEEAEGQTLNARSGRLPRLELLGGYSRVDENKLESFEGSPIGDDQAWSLDLQASQQLYSGGAITSGIDSAMASQSAAEAQYSQAVQDALLVVHEAWFRVLLNREEVTVRQAAVDLLERQLQTTRDRYETGSDSRFELLRAEVALANGKPQLIRAKNDFRLSIVDLLLYLGLEIPEEVNTQIVGELTYKPNEIDLSSALSMARQNRPEYISLDRSIDAAEAQVRGARSGGLPNLNLVAGYGIQKSGFSNALDDTRHGWTVGLQGSWTIWDGQATRGNVLSAQSRLRQSELARSELDLLVGSEIRQALSSIQEAEELVEASRKVVDQAEEVLELAEDRYSVGSVIQLDIYEAQLSLTRARTNAVQALHDYNIAVARLKRAVGLL